MNETEIRNIILAKQAKRSEERDPETIRKRALDMAQLYAEGKTYSEIGEKYNLTRQRVHMIIKAFLKK